MTEGALYSLREKFPGLFLDMLGNGVLPTSLLSIAAEMAGEVENIYRDRARTALLALRDHPSPSVREGVAYGLALLGCEAEIVPLLRDTSHGVSVAAQSLLGTKGELL